MITESMTMRLDNPTWLTTPWGQDDPDMPRRNPIFRKTVYVGGKVESACIDICGLGHYELYINGARVGDRLLEPAFTDYDKRVHFTTYDISSYLENGENVFALYLGRGRYNMDTVSVWAPSRSSRGIGPGTKTGRPVDPRAALLGPTD